VSSKATRVNGKIVPGDWIVPGRGSSRFTTREKAQEWADYISTTYGKNVWGAKIEPEPSKSTPGTTVFQVYIRSLGGMEGLI